MNFLAEGIRPAVAAAWAYDGKPSRTVNLKPVVEFFGKKNKLSLTYSQLPEALPPEGLEGVAVLLISGRGQAFAPTSAASLDRLRNYLLNQNGLLVAEVTADADGLAFARSLSEAIIKLFPDAKLGPMPVKPGEPALTGVVDGGGRPLAAVLPVQMQANGAGLTATQIRQFIFAQVSTNYKEDYLKPELALDWAFVMEKEPDLLRGEEDARNQAMEDAANKGEEPK
jgi:hypothetical protein